MILLRTSVTLRCFPHYVYDITSFQRTSTWTLIWDVVTSQRPSHRYFLGPRESIYVPDSYWMLPSLWDGFVPRAESLADPSWEVTNWLAGQAVDLDIITVRSKHYHIRKWLKSHRCYSINTFVNKSAEFVSPSSFTNLKMPAAAVSQTAC